MRRSLTLDFKMVTLDSKEAFGGKLERKVVISAVGLIKRLQTNQDPHTRAALLAKAEQDCRGFPNDSMKNFFMILSGLALVNELESIFKTCQLKLKKRALGSFPEVKQRADSEMRDLLNLALQSAVLSGDAELTEKILHYARTNTMLLQLSSTWIQVALRLSQEDVPGNEDLPLLKTLLNHEIVYKRGSEELNLGYPAYPTARDH